MVNVDRTKERILDGAMEALAIHGRRRFSVSEASERSGVSRGTFYRYFPTKDALLNALTEHLGSGFRRLLQDRITDSVEADQRPNLVAQVVREYVDETPVLSQLLLAEPSFVQDFYTSIFCDLMKMVASYIEPQFSSLPAAKKQDLLAAAEIMVRVAISFRLVAPDLCGLPQARLTEQLAELARGAQVVGSVNGAGRREDDSGAR